MKDEIFLFKYEMAKDRDRFEHTLGDALDAKGAFILVALTLFATVVMRIISERPPIAKWIWMCLLVWTVGTLIASTGYLLVAVWQRTYKLPFVPSQYEPWIDYEVKRRLDAGIPEGVAQGEIAELHRQHLMKFIDTNHAINKMKSEYIGTATRFFAQSCVGMVICLGLLTSKVLF